MTSDKEPKAMEQNKSLHIDFHHHLSPPSHVAALKKAKLGNPLTLNWTPQRSLEEMDKAGIAMALLAVTTPGVAFLNRDDAHRLARECNEYGAKLVRDYPGRFGMFATLPIPYNEDK